MKNSECRVPKEKEKWPFVERPLANPNAKWVSMVRKVLENREGFDWKEEAVTGTTVFLFQLEGPFLFLMRGYEPLVITIGIENIYPLRRIVDFFGGKGVIIEEDYKKLKEKGAVVEGDEKIRAFNTLEAASEVLELNIK